VSRSTSIDASKFNDVYVHLCKVDACFCPPLSTRVDLEVYARKLVDLATRCECWDSDTLIGLVAFYDCGHCFYVTNFSICAEYRGTGLARQLFDSFLQLNLRRIPVMVRTSSMNIRAQRFYDSLGFVVTRFCDGEIEYSMNI
jgi:GNAT superfamily N-acetyltransferase